MKKKKVASNVCEVIECKKWNWLSKAAWLNFGQAKGKKKECFKLSALGEYSSLACVSLYAYRAENDLQGGR